MKKDHLQDLVRRMEFFEGKQVHELSDEQLRDFMKLRREVKAILPAVKEKIKLIHEFFYKEETK